MFKKGDLIFIWSGGFFAWLISFFSKVPHIAVAIDDDRYIEADFFKGVRLVGKVNLLNSKRYEVYSIPASDQRTNQFVQTLMCKYGAEYDRTGLIAYLTGFKLFQSSKRWFCSELVAYALKRVGLQISLNAYKVSPEDIYKWIIKNSGKVYYD